MSILHMHTDQLCLCECLFMCFAHFFLLDSCWPRYIKFELRKDSIMLQYFPFFMFAC